MNLFVAAVLWLLVSPAQTQSLSSQAQAAHSVVAEMRNVNYHFTDTVGVQILQLLGKLVPTKEIPVFDDKQSFVLAIDSAVITMSTDDLSHVLNEYVFVGKDAPMKDLMVSTEDNRLKIKGKLAEKGDIPFETVSEIQATPEGKIRLHTKHVNAAHLPVKGIMDLFGVKLADLINTKKLRGVTAEKDDLILDPEQILPPPQIRGKLTSIKAENGKIVQVFGNGGGRPHFAGARNFIAYRGAVLRFGKLTMQDTDLVLIDSDPKDPFDFSLDHYREQLVAGYAKTTPQFGLRVYMVDFNKLHRPAQQAKAPNQKLQINNARLTR